MKQDRERNNVKKYYKICKERYILEY